MCAHMCFTDQLGRAKATVQSNVTYNLSGIQICHSVSSYIVRVMDDRVKFWGIDVEALCYLLCSLIQGLGILLHLCGFSMYDCGTFRWSFDCMKFWAYFICKLVDLLCECSGQTSEYIEAVISAKL
jgi:hypothetical protein